MKYIRKTIIACLILLALTLSVFAAGSTPVKRMTLPQKMLPGTVVIYNSNLEPQILKGGYANSLSSFSPASRNPRNWNTTSYSQVELQSALEQYQAIASGKVASVPLPLVCDGAKVIYDSITGDINNIYYPDPQDPTGYSIHNAPQEPAVAGQKSSNGQVTWSWGAHNNTLTYRPSSDSFLGVGRATYFVGTYGSRDNILKAYDCATKMAYDYSKVGDQDVQIRNLDTDEVFTYHQADVGGLPDAIIDIWGEENIRELAGTPDGEPTNNANNVRYYHVRFSDQAIPG